MLTGLMGLNQNFFLNSSNSVARNFLMYIFTALCLAAAFASSLAKCFIKDKTIDKTNARVT